MPNRRNQENYDDFSGQNFPGHTFTGDDAFVFVSDPSLPPLTAVAVLNMVTNNFPDQTPFIDFFNDNPFNLLQFLPPVLESFGNGDDLLVTFTAEDLSIKMTVFADADGSDTVIKITPLLIDPADFADLGAPADQSNPADFDLNDVFAMFGFEPANPFAGLVLPDDLTFGTLGFSGGGFSDLRLGFDAFDAFGGFGGFGGGGFFGDFGSGFVDTDFSSLRLF